MNNVMKTKPFFFVLALMSMFAISSAVYGQANFRVGPKPELKVTGTSTLHDWEMVSTQATGEAVLLQEGGKLQGIQKLSVTMPAESLKSGKNAMDKNTYAALDTKKHKELRFVLTDITSTGSNTWNAKGNFTIAGVTQPASFEVRSSQSGGSYNFQGKYAFKLTDYKIDPPTALMGTVKTGNEVVIHFNLALQPVK